MLRVAGLFIHPVKSLRACAVNAVEIDALGLAGDRRFLVVDAAGDALTQRAHPRMACVATQLEPDGLTLSAAGAGAVTVPTAPDPGAARRAVNLWQHRGLLAEDCGTAAAAWLSGFLGIACHLVRIGPDFHRPVLKAAARPGDRFAFNDGSPILVVGQASLDRLNDWILEGGGEPVPMARFRPNLVLTGCAPFAEDAMPRLRFGAVVLRHAGQSDRCIVTTTDQHTGERGREPLRTLARFRRDPALHPTAVWFGVNFINETKSGILRLGDEGLVD